MKLHLSLERRGNHLLSSFQKIGLTALAIACIAFGSIHAQVNNYSFVKESGTYVGLTDATIVAQATQTNNLENQLWDITLPFDFMFNGELFQEVKLSSKGYLILGATLPFTTTNSPISSTEIYKGAISILSGTLVGNKNGTEFGTLSTKTIMEDNETVFVIEYKNWSFFTTSTENYVLMDFQIHLRANGIIKMVYGDFRKFGTYASTTYPQVGLRGATSGDTKNLKNGNPSIFSNPEYTGTASSSQNLSFSNQSIGKPTNGQTNIFTPHPCQAPNAVTITDVTATTALLTATSISTTNFDYEFRTSGSGGSTGNGLKASGTVPSLTTIANLPMGTRLFAYVRSNCSNSFSGWKNLSTSTTSCGTAELPYSEGFNQTAIPGCWSSEIVSGNTTSKISYVSTANSPTISPREGSHFTSYKSDNASNEERLITLPINTQGVENVMVEFFFYHNSLVFEKKDSLILTYSIDNGANWLRAKGFSRIDGPSGWAAKKTILPVNAGNVSNLKIGFLFKSANGMNMAIDSFVVKAAPVPTYTSVNGFEACVAQNQIATINGTYLDNSTVTLNGNNLTIISNTSNQIKFNAPVGTNGNIQVTNPNGTFVVTQSLKVLQTPSLTLSNKNIYVCSDAEELVTITSPIANFDEYSWSNPSVTGNATIGYTLSSTSNTSFVLTGVKTIDGIVCTQKETATFRIIPSPIVTQNFVTESICEGTVKELKINHNRVESTYGNLSYLIGPNPFDNHYGGFKQQSIYTARELVAMGWTSANGITSIQLRAATINSGALQGFRIRIAHTDSVETAANKFITQGFTEYYLNNFQPVVGDNSFTLNAPFFWDGTHNIVIEFAYSNNNTGNGTPYNTAFYETTELNSTNYYFKNNNTPELVYQAEVPQENARKRSALKFGMQTAIPEANLHNVNWVGGNLFLESTTENAYTNENVKSVFYKAPSTSATLTAVVENIYGCATNTPFNVNINPIKRTSLTETACNSFTYGEQVLTESGIYTENLQSSKGCDSIVTLNLTIVRDQEVSIARSSCGTYNFHGQLLTQSGVYTTRLTSIHGCDSIVKLTLTMNSVFQPIVELEDGQLIARNNLDNPMYQWFNCTTNTPISGATAINYTPTANGSYKVSVANGTCTGVSDCFIFGTNAVESLDDLKLKVAPNPTNDFVVISYNGSEDLKVNVMDASGKILKTVTMQSESKLDLSNFAPGVYLLSIEGLSMEKTIRVIKQ